MPTDDEIHLEAAKALTQLRDVAKVWMRFALKKAIEDEENGNPEPDLKEALKKSCEILNG